ncbi:MAG: hypothetical protein H0X39_00585 [Actinobacteria bacterium]|nr:hypothetical protein [Actinomycetota bacterium]
MYSLSDGCILSRVRGAHSAGAINAPSAFEQYDTIRKFPRRFFNVTGHERQAVEARAERIILVVGSLTVVEKRGVAGEIAAEAHELST